MSNSDFPAHSGPVTGRLAPSPTGYLHLGNAWAFLCAWLGARAAGGRLIMRIEDIDPQRSKPELITALCEDLHWLGLDWDEGPDLRGAYEVSGAVSPASTNIANGVSLSIPHMDKSVIIQNGYLQSNRFESYRTALLELEKIGLIYRCFCTRKELRSMAGAPQAGEPVEGIYPGKCRALSAGECSLKLAEGCNYSWRLRFQENLKTEYLSFNDLVYGRVELKPEQAGGDFAVCRSDGVFAYQLAVVLDDIAMGVTQVVRGVDILPSTPRQLFLYDLLKAAPPEYAHVPLVLDHEGERLAKRHASISLRGLREAGVRPEAITGWLAHWAGLREHFALHRPADLLADFCFSAIRRDPPLLPRDIADVLQDLSR